MNLFKIQKRKVNNKIVDKFIKFKIKVSKCFYILVNNYKMIQL